jgi:hypothetical protein
MWSDKKQYYWVVICKNGRFHAKHDALFGHTIPLAETTLIRVRPPYRFRSPFDARSAERSTPIVQSTL